MGFWDMGRPPATGSALPGRTATTALALVNGWQSAQGLEGTGNPAVSVTGGVVHLSGSLTQPGGGGEDLRPPVSNHGQSPAARWPGPRLP